MTNYKTITIEEETLKGLDALGVEYAEGNTVYRIDRYDARPYLVGFLIGILLTTFIFVLSATNE